jgi:hypothetical protein
VLETVVRILALAILWFVQAILEFAFEQLARGLGTMTKKLLGLKVRSSGMSEIALAVAILLIGVPLILGALVLVLQTLKLLFR